MSDRPSTTLTDGSPVTSDHREIDPRTGQQKGYVVLSAEERAKGFVRPVRRAYQHVGSPGPQFPTRPLTPEEHGRYDLYGYLVYEEYPSDHASGCSGRFWTQEALDGVAPQGGCGAVTTMALSLAETYARDPSFYSGTFCATCRKHFPLDQFVWDGTQEQVGS